MNIYDDIVMSEQHHHVANKYKDIVNLQGSEAYHGDCPSTACILSLFYCMIFVFSSGPM